MSADVVVEDLLTEIDSITADEARELFDAIRVAATVTYDLVVRAHETRAWKALGYASWDDACAAEFESIRVKLPRADRIERHAFLRDAGLSLRAISSVTGADVKTIRSDLAGVGISHTSVMGNDGKTYTVPEKPRQDTREEALRRTSEIAEGLLTMRKHAIVIGLEVGRDSAEMVQAGTIDREQADSRGFAQQLLLERIAKPQVPFFDSDDGGNPELAETAEVVDRMFSDQFFNAYETGVGVAMARLTHDEWCEDHADEKCSRAYERFVSMFFDGLLADDREDRSTHVYGDEFRAEVKAVFADQEAM